MDVALSLAMVRSMSRYHLTAASVLLGLAAGCGGDGGPASDAAPPGDAAPPVDAPAAEAADAVPPADASSGADTADAEPPVGLARPLRLGARQSLTHACGIAAQSDGHVYVVGQTTGALWGAPVRGRRDLFLARLRPDGQVHWIRQLGGAGLITSGCAVTAGPGGQAYVAGVASGDGSIEGQPLPAPTSGFAARFEPGGERSWLTVIGEGPGPTEPTAIDLDGGVLTVLGGTQTMLGGQRPRGQGDVFLLRLDAGSGASGAALLFGSEVEDVPLGLASDGAAGSWIAFRRLASAAGEALGHELLRLDDGGRIVGRLSAEADPRLRPSGFALLGDHAVVLAETGGSDESQGYAFWLHPKDGSPGALQPVARGPGLRVRAFVCRPSGCAVAGQIRGPTGGQDEGFVSGFVDLFNPGLGQLASVRIAGLGGGPFTTGAALAPAPAGDWYLAGWSDANILGHPPIGDADGFAARVGAAGGIAGSN